ncbi:prolyl oligopeptidase family serine peptidase [bacterium]|nr:prolyl oligopeptidase family serine peptidase [bacterium]
MGWFNTGSMLAAVALAATACSPNAPAVDAKPMTGPESFDSAAHLWLEEVEGERALDWVRSQNDRTLGKLQSDPRYEPFYNEALRIAQSKERIPYGAIRKGAVYNFWQDETHVRGIWRRTPIASYTTDAPRWETLLDIDALAAAENANWVYKGVSCRAPDYVQCLVSLSDGGKDAVRVREFDAAKKAFVPGGFDLPEAKSNIEWVDADTLLVSTDWGEGTLTESGYPFIVKVLKRGQALADAREVFRGTVEDVGVFPAAFDQADGSRWLGVARAETFFTSSYHIFRDLDSTPVKVPLPPKATPQGLFDGALVATLEEDWAPDGQGSYENGELVALDWASFLKDGSLTEVRSLFKPTPLQAIQGVGITKDSLLLTISDTVVLKVLSRDRIAVAQPWTEVALPGSGSAGVIYSDVAESQAFLGYEGYLNPDSIYLYNAQSGALATVKSLPPWFDASPYKVEQFEATSTDGTSIPYFVVRSKAETTGPQPTLLYGYGGFQVSQTPNYSGTVGKLWLEQGGVYAVANIRGGGEFGPAWHQAGLKTKRQIVYDDFIAVAEDMIARGITSPQKLGAMGGSNGGLLMGVMFTQRPDLFNAIVCQVPLLDMLRYHLLLAGASWMDEYGDPDVPEERAWLEKLSPYHNIDPSVTYPEIYFETSTKDDRVHPAHARKMAKRLEDLGKPFLYYENIDGGHSAAANQQEAARRAALEFTYLAEKLIDE